MRFPKDRNGFSPQGNKDARFIDESRVPFLTRRRPATAGHPASIARKKGDFLEVRVVPAPLVATAAFIWAMLPRTISPLIYRRLGTATTRPTIDFTPILRSPSFLPTGREIYIGGNYILSLNHSSSTDANNVCNTWMSLINPRSGATEVLSGSAANVAGANVSFHDAMALPSDFDYWFNGSQYGANTPSVKPSIFATGWDAAVNGYGFGVIGRRELGRDYGTSDLYPANDNTVFDLVCFYGNTATRTLTRVDISGASLGWQFSRYFNVCTVGPGKLMALVNPYTRLTSTTFRGLNYPDPPKLLRSDDHGRSWYLETLPELVPHLWRRDEASGVTPNYSRPDEPGVGVDVCAPAHFHASPMGGGRIGMVVLCGKDFDHSLTAAEIAAPRPPEYSTASGGFPAFAAYFTRWKFFLSDAVGRNFENKPWPADAFDGFGVSYIYGKAPGEWSAPTLPVRLPAGFMNPITTAGPGTFFIAASEFQRPATGVLTQLSLGRFRMLYTLDNGTTWALSSYVDPTAASQEPEPVGIPIVARAHVGAADRGELYFLSASVAGIVRLFKTDAAFAAITKVYEQTVTNYYFASTQTRINGVFIGGALVPLETRYRARVLPGYPEFDKP